MTKKNNLSDKDTDKIITITGVVFGIIAFIGLLYKFPMFRSIFTETIPNGVINNYNSISTGLSQFFSELNKDSNLMNAYLIYFVVYVTIIFMTISFYLYNTDKSIFSEKTFVSNKALLFFVGIVLPLIKVLFFTSTNITGGSTNTNVQIITGATAVMVLFLMLYYMYNFLSKFQILIISDILTIFILLGLIVILSMLFIIFNNNLKLLNGWTGFFVYFIFYIPCLLIDFIEYIKTELKLTTNTIFILFILEVTFILCYLYLPNLINLYLKKGGKPLLEGNKFLDKKYTLATGSELKIVDKKSDLIANVEKKSKSSNQNFSLSMWVYINTQPPSDIAYVKETNIFNYGNDNKDKSRKPKIVYNYDASNNKINKFKIYFTNETSDTDIKNYYEFSMGEQKWNNIVINYNSNIADLFINGNLETSFTFAPNFNLPKYEDSDIVTIGSNNGLYGSICNIRYYYNPLSKSEIVNQYNLLMFKNPPINTI